MKPPVWAVALGISVASAAGVLVLLRLEPASDARLPFLYVAAASLVLAAVAGAWDWAERRRTRNSRRIIANLPTVGHDTEQAGQDQTADRRLLADAYDVFEEN